MRVSARYYIFVLGTTILVPFNIFLIFSIYLVELSVSVHCGSHFDLSYISVNGYPLLGSVEITIEHPAESKILGAIPRWGQCRYRNVELRDTRGS
jgi:hypothetical protein